MHVPAVIDRRFCALYSLAQLIGQGPDLARVSHPPPATAHPPVHTSVHFARFRSEEPLVVTRDRRGSGIGRQLVDHVIAEARRRQIRLLSVRPVARNRDAIRFYREAGFEVLGYIEMFMDLTGEREWIDGETIAGQEFSV